MYFHLVLEIQFCCDVLCHYVQWKLICLHDIRYFICTGVRNPRMLTEYVTTVLIIFNYLQSDVLNRASLLLADI